ncbi:hypothetical protein IAU59_005004 [Kwoniella sp. CBS 9459]
MESLSPECTPLKHRYDSCFNAWFEGYLQPALAAASASTSGSASASTSTSDIPSAAASPHSLPSGLLTTGIPVTGTTTTTPPNITGTGTPAGPVKKTPIITSWANAFPTRYRRKAKPTSSTDAHASSSSSSSATKDGILPAGNQEQEQEHHWYDFPFDDTPSEPEYENDFPDVGGGGATFEVMDIKTRAKVKAEEYQRNCGKVWEEYQGCLKKSIAQNESLSALLETAREEHPLGSLDGLKGTPWDSKAHFTSTE